MVVGFGHKGARLTRKASSSIHRTRPAIRDYTGNNVFTTTELPFVADIKWTQEPGLAAMR